MNGALSEGGWWGAIILLAWTAVPLAVGWSFIRTPRRRAETLAQFRVKPLQAIVTVGLLTGSLVWMLWLMLAA